MENKLLTSVRNAVFSLAHRSRVSVRAHNGQSVSVELTFNLIKIVICALFGLLVAYLCCLGLSVFISSMMVGEQISYAEAASKRSPSVFAVSAKPKVDLSYRAFGLTSKPAPVASVVKKDISDLESYSLIGTIPPVAAWFAKDGVTSLALKDQELGGYMLSKVEADRVIFKLGDDEYIMMIYFSGEMPQQRPKTSEVPVVQKRSDINNAEFDGRDGAVSRELLHSLLMNPYEELAKLRLIPTNGGMKIDRMASDSLLHQLGVKVGDELTGVNGISIKDVPSIMNAMNSMLSGTRLDFSVTRDNKAGKLGYQVK